LPTFNYKARNAAGELIEGELDASTAESVAVDLSGKGLIPTHIAQVTAASETNVLALELWPKKVSLDELIIFCRQMYALTKAGIPIIRAIKGLADSTRSKTLSTSLIDIVERLESGLSMAASMQPHNKVFSELFIAMIHVGENTGRLEEAFKYLSDNLEMERDTRKRVKQATRYPTMVFVAIMIALFVVNFLVIPQFDSVFKRFGADLPFATQVLVATSEFTLNYWWVLLIAMVGTVISFQRWTATEQGRLVWDRTKLRLPIAGPLYEQVTLSRFTRNFAMMLAAGVPLIQALAIASEAAGNHFVGARIKEMKSSIERGENLLRAARSTEIFTPLVLQMIAVGEETGALDSLLIEVADFYDEEADYSLKRLSESIEPILIVAMGAIVLVLALGVFLPIWDLGSAAMGRG
jgi:MSHA biogenesis protein MshG